VTNILLQIAFSRRNARSNWRTAGSFLSHARSFLDIAALFLDYKQSTLYFAASNLDTFKSCWGIAGSLQDIAASF
jgi:hypothetical protein